MSNVEVAAALNAALKRVTAALKPVSADLELLMSFAKVNAGTFVPLPNGDIDLRFPSGNPTPTPPNIVISTIPTQTPTQGVSFSQNFNVYASGSDLSGATYSMLAVTGTLGALGLAFATSTLSGATPVLGTGTFRLQISKSGTTFTSNPFAVNVIAAVVTDTISPTTPLAPSLSIAGTVAQVFGTWPADVRTSTIAPTDPVKVVIERAPVVNGVVGAYAVSTMLTAAGSQPSPPVVSGTIGTLTSPSSSNDGRNLSVTVSDGSFTDSAENAQFTGWQVQRTAGTLEIVMTIPAFTASNPYASFGPVLRASLTARDACALIQRRADSANLGTSSAYRLVAAGVAGFNADATLSGDVTVKLAITYPGNVVTYSFFDAPSALWVPYATQVVNLPAQIYAGGQGQREGAGTAVVFTATNVWLNVLGNFSYDDTVSLAQTYAWRVLAKDSTAGGNATPYSPVTTRSTTTATTVKFNPGMYVWYTTMTNLSASSVAAFQTWCNQYVAGNPNIKGVKLALSWKGLESNTLGDYSGGFALFDQLLSFCDSLSPKVHILLQIQERTFGANYTTYPPDNQLTGAYPSYLLSTAYGANDGASQRGGVVVQLNNPLQKIARVWSAAVMDRLIALATAYGGRYNDHPLFDMIGFEETAVGGISGFDSAGYYTQIKRWLTAGVTGWSRILSRLNANFTSNDAAMLDLFEHVRLNIPNAVVGGPDHEYPLPGITRSIQANQLWRGIGGGRDYRGTVPWIGEEQNLGLSRYPTFTNQNAVTYDDATMQASFSCFAQIIGWAGTPNQQWGGADGALAAINSMHALIENNPIPTVGGPYVTSVGPPPVDTTPDQFTFADQTDVATSTFTISTPITVAGLGVGQSAAVTVSGGGSYDLNLSGNFTTSPGSASNGTTVRAGILSSASNSTTSNVPISIGSVSDTFSVTTVASSSDSITTNAYSTYATRVVDTATASDVAGGTTRTVTINGVSASYQCYKTIGFGVNDYLTAGGRRLVVKSGAYTLTADVNFPAATGVSTSARVVIMGDPADTMPAITCGHYRFEPNFAGIRSWIVIRKLEFKDGLGDEVNSGFGAFVSWASGYISPDCLEEFCSMHDLIPATLDNTAGIVVSDTVRHVIRECKIYNISRTTAGNYYADNNLSGILGYDADALLVYNCNIFNVRNGLRAKRNSSNPGNGWTISNNKLYDLQEALCTDYSGASNPAYIGFTIDNNVSWSSRAAADFVSGYQMRDLPAQSMNWTVHHNTVDLPYGNTFAAITGIDEHSNIFLGGGTQSLATVNPFAWSTTFVRCDYNAWFFHVSAQMTLYNGGTTRTAGNLAAWQAIDTLGTLEFTSNPGAHDKAITSLATEFTNAAAHDYSLTVGSALRNAGVPVSGTPTNMGFDWTDCGTSW